MSRNRVFALLLLVAFAGLCLRSAWLHSGVPDEVAVHAPGGFLFAVTGHFAGGIGNPPLGMLWLAAPTALLGLPYEPFGVEGLFPFRAAAIVAGILCGSLVYVLASSVFGRKEALGATFFFAFSPSFLAHSSLATLDVPITACILAGVLCARRLARSGALVDFAWLGFALGVAASVKVQGLLLWPLVATQILCCREATWLRDRQQLLRSCGGGALVVGVAWLVLHFGHGTLPGWEAGLLPEDFVEATRRKIEHSAYGHVGYLLGELTAGGSLFYFPVVLAVKVPIPLWVAAAVAALGLRSRDALLWIALPALFFFGAAVASGINIGVRHLLPCIAFLVIGAGGGLVLIFERARAAAWILVAVQVAEALWASPHHLVYFNALAGGADGGYRVLLDSNYDWGQHDEPLREHVDRLARAAPGLDIAIDPDPLVARSGAIFVGASALHGILGPGEDSYAWLREREPTERIARTWFGYRVPEGEAPADPIDERTAPVRIAIARHVRLAVERSAGLSREDRVRSRAAAHACFEVHEYACAANQALRRLARDPSDHAAFWLASELAARRRLGVLRFSGTEYLDGFAPPLPPAADWLSLEELRDWPLSESLRQELALLHSLLGDEEGHRARWDDALVQYELAAALRPGDFTVSYKLGWLLATHPDASSRDGDRALELARLHGEQSAWRTAAAFDLLGAAQAERGEWGAAVEAGERALERASEPARRAELVARIDGYRVGRAHRLDSR